MKDFKGVNVILIGLARSGTGVLKTLKELGAKVTVNDIKKEEELGGLVRDLEEQGLIDEKILGRHPESMEGFDYVVLSPGVPPGLDFIQKAVERGANVIGELELSYIINPLPEYIGITGTNGKTTTTALVGEMFKNAGVDTRVVGNIGVPVISQVLNSNERTSFITEISSFQLETVKSFKVGVAAVLNITPDHLNRHGTMENYIAAKARIFENQSSMDTAVLNFDDSAVMEMSKDIKAGKWYFSSKNRVPRGLYKKGDEIWYSGGVEGLQDIHFIDCKEIFIPGDHNVENAMAASLIAVLSGIDLGTVKRTLREFKGVEHRIEFVAEHRGVNYYNDSKATNPDASIKAVEAMRGNTVLIAGGMDKENEFDQLIQSFSDKIGALVLYGETKEIIKKSALKNGFENIYSVDDLEAAVKNSNEIILKAEDSQQPYKNVLLSPACASWDMYKDFEERGNHFKKIVREM